MDSNGKHRKRGGRMGRNINVNEGSPPHDLVAELSAVAASPTLEECEFPNNTPPSECRRSSRKKIIKFDVRDLLNKNRKTHKIQIEARIDSNVPTTSKAPTGGGTREDLLSKHKTFLEKSAIFRRYSVSQEYKALPPPLPIPPLLGQTNDNKDSGFSGTSSCQEFLSHALIMPKEPSSLIVAQIESNKPSMVGTVKRKNSYNSQSRGSKIIYSSKKSPIISNSDKFPVIQQKKRGRPAKNKNVTPAATSAQEISGNKKITPEKANNWKEYKACLAQQSGNIIDEKKINKEKNNKGFELDLRKKQKEIKHFDDTLQSDISRSDDDGNFSGFQSSKDDLRFDSPLLQEQDFNSKPGFSNADYKQQFTNDMRDSSKNVDNKISPQSNNIESIFKQFGDQKEKYSIYTELNDMEILVEPVIENISRQQQDKNLNVLEKEPDKYLERKKQENAFDFTQNYVIESKCELSGIGTNSIRQSNLQYNSSTKDDKFQVIQLADAIYENSKINKKGNSEQQLRNNRGEHRIPNIEDDPTINKKVENIRINEIQYDSGKKFVESENVWGKFENERATIENTCSETETNLSSFKTVDESQGKFKTVDVLQKSIQIVEQRTGNTFDTKPFSRTSSSSESENISERSSSSSEAFSSCSSSSPRSYKSGDKLKVSIKRIPLPKSSSTSQIAKNEELKNEILLKENPPTVECAKRQQKKCKKSWDERDDDENIGECFYKNTNNDQKVETKCEQFVTDAVSLDVDPIELGEEFVGPISKNNTEYSYKSIENTEINNTLINESLYLKYKPDSEKVTKRKSSQNVNKCEIVEDTSTNEYEEGENPLDNKNKQVEILQNESEEYREKGQNLLNIQKNIIATEKQKYEVFSDIRQNVKLENKDYKKENAEFQLGMSTKLFEKTLFDKNEQGLCLQNNLLVENNLTDKTVKSLFDVCDRIKVETAKTETNSSITNEKEISTSIFIFQSEFQEITNRPKNIGAQIEDVPETTAINSNDLEVLTELTSSKIEANKEFCIDINHATEKVKEEKIVTTSSEINKDKKHNGHQVTSCQKYSTQNSRLKSILQDEQNMKINLVDTTMSDRDISCYEESYKIKKDAIPDHSELSTKIERITNAVISEVDSTESNKILKEYCASLKENSVQDTQIPEVVDIITLGSSKTGIKSPSRIPTLTSEHVSNHKSENSIVLLSNKDIECTHALICPTHLESNIEYSVTCDVSKNSKENFLTAENQFNDTEIASCSSKVNKQDYSSEIRNTLRVNSDKETKEENSRIQNSALKMDEIDSRPIRKCNKPVLVSANKEISPTEFKSIQVKNVAIKNLPTEQYDTMKDESYVKIHYSKGMSPQLPFSVSSNNNNENLPSQETVEAKKIVELTTATCGQGTQNESSLQENNKQIILSADTKQEETKQWCKNLPDDAQDDWETDSSNGRSTPKVEKITQKHDTRKTKKERVNDKEINCAEIESRLFDKTSESCFAREQISEEENTQTNLLSSQIKNVSIETNILLDILRTVQSNTEAALKVSTSPINIEGVDSEPTVNSIVTSLAIFDIDASLKVKKSHLSPGRSNSASPLTLKRITSPTRSSSSSPLTLKKVTRRYERRTCRTEGFSHKTLEETFAEIAEQSSKAVLASKDCNVNDHEARNEKYLNFADSEKRTHLEETFFNAEKKIDEAVSQIINNPSVVPSKEQININENVSEVSESKLLTTKRARKLKTRSPEAVIPEINEAIDINKSLEQNDSNIKISQNEFSESGQIENLPEYKSKSSSSLLSYQQLKSTELINVLQTSIEKSIKQLEDTGESKLINKNKHEPNTVFEENTFLSNIDTYKEKEHVIRTPKQSMKKRYSLNKSDSKLLNKRHKKKIKNVEVSLNLQPEESLSKNIAITHPPSKRGRKPKNLQTDTMQITYKKKNKKDIYTKDDCEGVDGEKKQLLGSESEVFHSLGKSLDEKIAKKKRQKKLKEAFEAALTDDVEKCQEASQMEVCSSKGLTLINVLPCADKNETILNDEVNEKPKISCITPVDTDEDLDPLKDIEKFIADGVNLLKRDYKLDEGSVDEVAHTTDSRSIKIEKESSKTSSEDTKFIFNTFETPADTHPNTPTVTPPPKSPTSIDSTIPDENSGVRRSHRIKLITKTPKALVGRGLVKDRERFSIKDDVETKSHYTIDDHLTDLAEVEAKNAKFLKEMEERLSNFQVIKDNDYLCERVISREAKKMICDCFLTHEEEGRGELGCGEDCLNRLLMIECGSECNVKERCTNKRFQKLLCSPCRVFRTEKKGFGIMADVEILPGEFIMEYVGEVIDTEEFENRRIMYSQDKNRHYYFMALRSDAIIDATIKGNISRFINHSCDPNAETQKWTVNGELRIGFFSRKSIMPGEEITFNYQYQRYGREAQRCYCESTNCRGWIGQEPTSDEGEQMDDEDYESEDEEEEADTSNLLVQDDDEDSDDSVADPEEVQKRLELAAAQAEVDLAPLQLLEDKVKQEEVIANEDKYIPDLNKPGNEEDSKSKFKRLLSKMAEKVAAKQKQNKREQKLQRKKKSKEPSSELTNKLRFLEDPDIEDEVKFLKECGLKNQSDTLRLSRLMVRAKLIQTRLNLLMILRKGDLPCRRLFLDYHGLRLLHGWMSEDAGNMQIRLSLLQTLETLPIANKTVLTDSKVMQVVRNWCGSNTNVSPNDDSSGSNSNSQDTALQSSTQVEEGTELVELQKLAIKLLTTWEGLPEIFRIPKKERIEQMKEHEREADRQYAASAEIQENTTPTDRFRRDRFGRGLNASNSSCTSNRFVKPNKGSSTMTSENLKKLSKTERREMFAAKVARDEAEKRLAEERREFEIKCRFFGLDAKKTRPKDIPFCVNPATGQWFSIERKPIATPPSYAHVKVPAKLKSTDLNDYQLPSVCSNLPPQWKYAITTQGTIYYYHNKQRISQWEPPSPAQLKQCELEAKEEDSESEISTTAGEDSSDDDDDMLIGMDAAQLKSYIDRKVELRRQKRYQRLVDQRSISPRREEDRVYNQIEVRKYKENKEKIRKRKEDIRRKRAEALRQASLSMCSVGNVASTSQCKLNTENKDELGVLPIQDYLLSSDEEVDLKSEVNNPLIDKIVEGDKIVDELDALTINKQLKRSLPVHRDINEPTTSLLSTSIAVPNTIVAKLEYKKRKLEKKEKRKPKEQDAKYRKNKEKFRCEIAGIIVHHLKPYLKETCTVGRIQSNEDFNHLARKLTHFVMIKELKYCESVGQTLVVTESVKSKSREFIKKYMAKYGDVYIKPTNDPDFKDIPFII